MERLEQDEQSLARLAADLGFADQAHLTRTVREHLGHTPTALHRILDPDVETPQVVADSVRAARSIGSCPSKSSSPPAAG